MLKKAFKLVRTTRVSLTIQSEFFISVLHNYIMLKVLHNMGSELVDYMAQRIGHSGHFLV